MPPVFHQWLANVKDLPDGQRPEGKNQVFQIRSERPKIAEQSGGPGMAAPAGGRLLGGQELEKVPRQQLQRSGIIRIPPETAHSLDNSIPGNGRVTRTN